jgi:hypothetical protein
MLGSLPCGLFPIACYRIALFVFEKINLSKFLSQMGDYSYYTFENGRLCMRGLHRHGFPLLLWDALLQTGYRDIALENYSQLYEEHGLQRCEVYVDISSHPVFPDGSPWSTWAIGAYMDDAMEKAAHKALTALCL